MTESSETKIRKAPPGAQPAALKFQMLDGSESLGYIYRVTNIIAENVPKHEGQRIVHRYMIYEDIVEALQRFVDATEGNGAIRTNALLVLERANAIEPASFI